MTKCDQEIFYKLVGQALTVARQRRNISVSQLSSKSGEHHKTIRGIESGKPHSLHHAVWMKNILGIDVNKIIKDMEGNNHGEEIIDIAEGITGEERKVLNSFIDSIGRERESGTVRTLKDFI